MDSYAGIGSRTTPEDILKIMRLLGGKLATLGFILRSGGADGADKAFEEGCDAHSGNKEIFLPWKGFNGNTSLLFQIPDEAIEIARMFHPAPHSLTPATEKLMARNSQQILGQNLNDHCAFVACWTPDGAEYATTRQSGGTGQAIRIANHYGIPVINLHNPHGVERIKTLVDRLKD